MLLQPHPLLATCTYKRALQTFEAGGFAFQCSSTPQIVVVVVMALLCYFQFTAFLPTAKKTRLRDTVTQLANPAILHKVQQAKQLKNRQGYTVMLDRQKSHKFVGRPDFPK